MAMYKHEHLSKVVSEIGKTVTCMALVPMGDSDRGILVEEWNECYEGCTHWLVYQTAEVIKYVPCAADGSSPIDLTMGEDDICEDIFTNTLTQMEEDEFMADSR